MNVDQLVSRVRAFRGLPPPPTRRALREGSGASQGDFAKVLRVDRATVSRWETGARTPRGELLVRYAELLEMIRRA